MIIYSIVVFLLGLIFASFVNAWVWRTAKGESIASGRSKCPKCSTEISWYDNIPVVSYLLLQGKCRVCKGGISWQYPVVELAGGVVLVALFFLFSPLGITSWAEFVLWSAISMLLLAAFVYDARHMILPDKFMMPAILLACGVFLLGVRDAGWATMYPQLISTTVFTAAYTAMWYFSGGKFLGDGDIRLAVVMGLLLSVAQLLVGIFVAYLAGALVGIGLIVVAKKKRGSRVPFGPFLIFGLYFALFFGEQIASWYLSLV